LGVDLLVLASHTRPRSTAPINHQVYCEGHGLRYRFDVTPYSLVTKFDQKLLSILGNLDGTDWLFWMDDDAFFMDHQIDLKQLIPDDPAADFVFCNSPVNPKGQWTVLNTGLFFVRNRPSARALLEDVLATDPETVRAWWDPTEHGHFTHGDQDRVVYQVLTRGLLGNRVHIVDFTAFNARSYHFTERRDQHFVLHLCGEDKRAVVADFRRRFGLDPHLLPPDLAPEPGGPLARSMFFETDEPERGATERLLRKVAPAGTRQLLRNVATAARARA